MGEEKQAHMVNPIRRWVQKNRARKDISLSSLSQTRSAKKNMARPFKAMDHVAIVDHALEPNLTSLQTTWSLHEPPAAIQKDMGDESLCMDEGDAMEGRMTVTAIGGACRGYS